VDEAVDHGGGDGVVAEGLAPSWAGSLVAAGDELEEQVGGLGLERDAADLVDDDERVAAQPGELGGELPGGVGVGEAGDPVRGGGERDAVTGLAGADRQAGGEVGLAGAGPRKTTLPFPAMKSRVPRWAMASRLTARSVRVRPQGLEPRTRGLRATIRDLCWQRPESTRDRGHGIFPGREERPMLVTATPRSVGLR
jgi:hypothetical protein